MFQYFTANTFSQFLWFKNPGGDDAPYQGPWEVGHLISENDCDTFMGDTMLTVDGTDYDVIFTTGYFMDKLSVYWNAEGMWDNSTEVNFQEQDSLTKLKTTLKGTLKF